MQQYLDLHYTVLEDLSQQMKEAGKKASALLDNIDEVVAKNDGEIDIKLQQIKLSKKVLLDQTMSLFLYHKNVLLSFKNISLKTFFDRHNM